jgi:hypothetical protein
MPGKRFKAEEIVNKLRQADVELARGSTVAAVCKLLGITDATYFRWRKAYGGMKVDQAKRPKALSFSRPFSRFNASRFTAPYSVCQRCSVILDTPSDLATSASGVPLARASSACLSFAITLSGR